MRNTSLLVANVSEMYINTRTKETVIYEFMEFGALKPQLLRCDFDFCNQFLKLPKLVLTKMSYRLYSCTLLASV